MNIGHWFNPCDYNNDELTERILNCLDEWEPRKSDDNLRVELHNSVDMDEYPEIRESIERDAIDALNEYAPVGHWVGYDDGCNSFGCYPIEEDK